MKLETSQGAKSLDKDANALAPITAIQEDDQLTKEKAKHTLSTAVELIGNTNAQIVQCVNKSLLPLVKEDTLFRKQLHTSLGMGLPRGRKISQIRFKQAASTENLFLGKAFPQEGEWPGDRVETQQLLIQGRLN